MSLTNCTQYITQNHLYPIPTNTVHSLGNSQYLDAMVDSLWQNHQQHKCAHQSQGSATTNWCRFRCPLVLCSSNVSLWQWCTVDRLDNGAIVIVHKRTQWCTESNQRVCDANDEVSNKEAPVIHIGSKMSGYKRLQLHWNTQANATQTKWTSWRMGNYLNSHTNTVR